MRRSPLPCFVGLRVLLAFMLLCSVGITEVVAAQETPADSMLLQDEERPTSIHPEARRAISEIRSPYCPGLMLEVCPSPSAADLRDSIETLARGGLSADSIVERVIGTYGEEWRAVPRRQGWGWWAWLMPPVMLAVGIAAIGAFLRSRRKARPAGASEATREAGPEDEARLREALRDLDDSEQPEW